MKESSNIEKGKFHKSKVKITAIIVMISCMVIMVIMVVVWAKFIKNEELKASIPDNEVAVYYMDVLGDDKTKSLSKQILVEDLNPGETRNIDIYIRNGNESKVCGVDMNYEIEIIHTDNMPLTYELYDENGNLLSGNVLTDSDDIYINDGTKIRYDKSEEEEKFILKIDKEDESKIDEQKYTLKISWGEDIGTADFKYVKEIDFLYLNVYAYESSPLNN